MEEITLRRYSKKESIPAPRPDNWPSHSPLFTSITLPEIESF